MYTRYVKGVPFPNGRYEKVVPFLPKLVYEKGKGLNFGKEPPRLKLMSSPPGNTTLFKDLLFWITFIYLQILPWLFLFTVHTRHNTPHARFCVIVQFFSFHYLRAMFVGTSDKFERAGFQVSLLQAMLYMKKKEKVMFFPWLNPD